MKFLLRLVLLTAAAYLAASPATSGAQTIKPALKTIIIKKNGIEVERFQPTRILMKQLSPTIKAALSKPTRQALHSKNVITIHVNAAPGQVRPAYGGPSSVLVSAQDFGSATVGGSAVVKTLTFSAAAGTNMSFATTAGTNFTIQSSSCDSQCSVQVAFAPLNPGLLTDAVSVTDSSGNLLDQTFISGTGMGQQVGYEGDQESVLGRLTKTPTGVAVGPNGSYYIVDQATGTVYILVANSNSINSVQIANVGKAGGIAVDGAGTIYVADQSNNQVVAHSVDGSQRALTTTPLSNPSWVAVDGASNVYISDTGNNRIIKLSNQGVETTLVAGLTSPAGIAINAAGDLYYADQATGGRINVLRIDGTTQTFGQQLGTMQGLGVQADARIYYTTPNGYGEISPNYGESSSSSDGSSPYGIAVAPNGDMIYSDPLTGYIQTQDRSSGNFILGTAVGTTTGGTFSVSNTGNTPLTLSYTSLTGDSAFSLDSGTVCNSSTVLQSGQTCDVTTDFTPPAIGNYQGNFSVTSDSLARPDTVVAFTIYGDGQGYPTNTNLSVSPSTATAGASVTLTAQITRDSGPDAAPTGSVQFNNNGVALATVNLAADSLTATYTTTSLPAGTNSITAVYSGDTYYDPSTSSPQTVTVTSGPTAPSATTTALAVSSASINAGQSESLTATVSSNSAPSGNVTFSDQNGTLGSATLVPGSATSQATLTLTKTN